jgi:hypothetical protein
MDSLRVGKGSIQVIIQFNIVPENLKAAMILSNLSGLLIA